jgi:hypothetical protein
MKTATSNHLLKTMTFLGAAVLLAGCGETAVSSSSKAASSSAGASTSGGFSFNNPHSSGSSSSTSSASSSQKSLDVEVLATINANGGYTVEGEDCDTSDCTLQPLKSTFFEDPGAQFPTSGGECIASIVAPSILAYKISVVDTCDITFYTVSAKFEDPWILDDNVAYYLDDGAPFVTGYSAFGHTDANQWYNWKTVELGTVTGVTAGVHQFNIKVLGSFPNTDCFKMEVNNYAGVASTSSEAAASSAV